MARMVSSPGRSLGSRRNNLARSREGKPKIWVEAGGLAVLLDWLFLASYQRVSASSQRRRVDDMENQDSRRDAPGIVVTDAQALAQKSSSLVRRGLLSLSAADMAGVIEGGKEMTSSLSSDDELSFLIAHFTKL